MMRWVIAAGIRFRLLVLVGAAALMVLGVTQLRTATVDALPEFSPTYVEVQTQALGLSAAEMEQLITVPLEADLLNGVAWLRHIRSLVQFDGPPGTSLPEMNRITTRASRELRALPGVRAVGSQVGRAVLADQVVGVNSGQLWVSLDPATDYERAVSDITGVVHGYPGITSDVLTYEKRRTGDILAGSTSDVTVRVYGQDPDVLRHKAQDVLAMLSGIEGVQHPRIERAVQEPTAVLTVDLAAAQRFGLKPSDVRRAAATLLSGTEVGSLYQGQKIFQVVVWGTPDARRSLSSLRELVIDTPSGGHVRLGDVAQVALTGGVLTGGVLTGGVLAALASGQVITLGSLLGLLTVFGIATRHAVLLVQHYQDLRREDPAADRVVLVTRGTRERLSPILSSTLASAALFVPALIVGNVAGLEIVQPMAVAVLGGLVTSAFLNLVVVPVLYLSVWPSRTQREGDQWEEEARWAAAIDAPQHSR